MISFLFSKNKLLLFYKYNISYFNTVPIFLLVYIKLPKVLPSKNLVFVEKYEQTCKLILTEIF